MSEGYYCAYFKKSPEEAKYNSTQKKLSKVQLKAKASCINLLK